MAMKILVADDEDGIREALEMFLTSEGHSVALAKNGREAVEMVASAEYDLVLTDLRMPEMDGFEAIEKIKEIKPKVKIIIVSGLPDEETFERAISVARGMVEGFISKPFKPADLRNALTAITEGNVLPSFGLTPEQLKALNEIGRAGVENTSTALSQIAQKDITASMEKVLVSSMPHYIAKLDKAGQEEASVCVTLSFRGDISGRIITVFPWESGLEMVDTIEKKDIGSTSSYDEKTHVMLKTAAQVFSAAYLKAAGKLIGLNAAVELGELSFDNEKKIIGEVSKKVSDKPENVFIIETGIAVSDTDIKVSILLFPDPESLKRIFKQAGSFN